ncbi:MAG: hypothetical protein EU539_08320 [Promethearchaeota archaeon]|nr:MAG: hypothetical protein EU539_08320 [Candidatus Lokiarchaeota archaeon]
MLGIKKEKDEDLEEIDVVKKYFSRIFTVLSKATREKLMNLNFSEGVKKLIIKELAFLSEEKQKEYLDELNRLYDLFLKRE